MNEDSQAAMLMNDLDNMVYRIEALQAHPRYTDALTAVKSAKEAIQDGRSQIHQFETAKRFAQGKTGRL